MNKLPPKSATLYLTPSDQTLRVGPDEIECLYLTMHLNEKASDAYRKRINKWHGQSHGWRIKRPASVPFSREKQPADAAVRRDAPIQCWAVLDLKNGHPESPDGKQYVFAFNTAKQAKAYVKYAETRITGLEVGVTDISKPFKLYQCLG
jgi:hypothetical protein